MLIPWSHCQFYGEHKGPRLLALSPRTATHVPSFSPRPFLLSTSRTNRLNLSHPSPKLNPPSKVQHAASGPFLALALSGPSAVKTWRTLIGPTHVYKTQWTHPDTLRARYGLSDTRNGFHGAFAKWERTLGGALMKFVWGGGQGRMEWRVRGRSWRRYLRGGMLSGGWSTTRGRSTGRAGGRSSRRACVEGRTGRCCM